MIVHVEKIRATPWHLADLSLMREIFLIGNEGEFKTTIVFSVGKGPGGALVPLTSIRLGSLLNSNSSQDKLWFVARLVRGDEVGASVAMQCFEKGRTSLLVATDKDTFSEFSGAFLDEGDWHLEIVGETAVMAECPLPNNANFSEQFSRLLDSARQATTSNRA